jgi:hypothetical protein
MILDHLHEFVEEIYKTRFFKLFFHWSWQVRNLFYFFVLFFLNHRIKNIVLLISKISSRPTSNDVSKRENDYAENVSKLIFFNKIEI